MKCKCGHTILSNGEHYIELEDRTILCEDCFLEYSLEQLNAILKQNIKEK